MIHSLLVANRGEIASRIFRTARGMGMRCIAVHSEADATALHVSMADEAVCIGPAPAAESYLRIEAVLDAARRTGAEAIHPGYGFLSENAAFADACMAAGMIFVGPSANAMRAMGSKAAAKALMARAGVPLVPGYHGEDQDPGLLAGEAARIGFPVLIKASAGGGGRGMRVVADPGAFPAALAAAQREAQAAFGDDRVLVEKYLAAPRHIEVQILADMHGTTLALSTRDCSIQRRHQKIVEEAPAPSLSEAMRARFADAAIAAARAVNYTNAGTIEFIAEGDDFFFMEMNTRLQVEHPVTEAITGLDLVAWQLRIAGGEALLFTEPPLVLGHAIEVRLCAEDPLEEWRPATGRLRRFVMPEGEGIRIDTGVREGDAITPFYDSMIAKIIVHAETREAAILRLGGALAQARVEGVTTNLAVLRAITSHGAFASGVPSTGFIATHGAALLALPSGQPRRALLAAIASLLLAEAGPRPAQPADPHSPWDLREGWRLHGAATHEVLLVAGAERLTAEIRYVHEGWSVTLAGETNLVSARTGQGQDSLIVRSDDMSFAAFCALAGDAVTVTLPGQGSWRIGISDTLNPAQGDTVGDDRIASPIPGRVAAVLCAVGDTVSRGQVLLVIEAMKTELRIAAPSEGTVARVDAAVGEQVAEGVELVTLATADAATASDQG